MLSDVTKSKPCILLKNYSLGVNLSDRSGRNRFVVRSSKAKNRVFEFNNQKKRVIALILWSLIQYSTSSVKLL